MARSTAGHGADSRGIDPGAFLTAPEPRRFFGWPGASHVRFGYALTILVTIWFSAVFVFGDWFTASHQRRTRIHFDAELQIPLVPSFALVYMSIYLLFAATPFVLRTRRQILQLALAQALAIFVAGICFLLIPGALAYLQPVPSELGVWKPLFDFADKLNLDYNLVPSLHVTLSIVCIQLFLRSASVTGKILLHSWGILIAASTLLTHQHHLIDVVAGYLVAFAMLYVSRRFFAEAW